MAEKKYVIDNAELMADWDWEKNNEVGFNPNEITSHSGKKVWWICVNGHSFDATVANRSNGKGCPICVGRKVLVGYNDLETWCIKNNRLDLIKEFDKEKNAFSMKEITKSCKKEVWWLCPNGHSYSATLHHRIKMNTGCGACSHKVFLSGHNDLQSTNPDIAKEFDVEKNGITPDQVMAGSNNKKYWFLCPKGHSYSATLLNRKKGRNCPICAKEMHVSFPEKAIFFYLKKYNFEVKENYRASYLKNKEFDIYIENINFAIEYDGKVWHKKTQRDIEKDHISEINGVQLIRIREIGCPDYDSASIKYYVTAESISELENAIRFVIKTANPTIESNDTLDINIERDRALIYELMELSEKSNSILNKRPEIELFWDYERNGMLKPDQVSFSSFKIAKFICPEGHRWESKVRNFYVSPKCPICSNRRIITGVNDLATVSPGIAQEWDYELNECSPNEVYYNNQSKSIHWICSKCGYKWVSRIKGRTNCPECKKKNKQINVYDAQTLAFLFSFSDSKELCKHFNLDYKKRHSNIASVCGRKQKTLMGKYILRHANDDEYSIE